MYIDEWNTINLGCTIDSFHRCVLFQGIIEQIVEMSLLGPGDAHTMFPSNLQEYEIAMSDELPSRIAL